MIDTDIKEIARVMEEKNWLAEQNGFGLWAMGPIDEDGTMHVLGMGRDIVEAFKIARRSDHE